MLGTCPGSLQELESVCTLLLPLQGHGLGSPDLQAKARLSGSTFYPLPGDGHRFTDVAMGNSVGSGTKEARLSVRAARVLPPQGY